MSDVDKTLRDRDPRYGNFFVQAQVSQDIKHVMSDARNWRLMLDFQREALELIAIKISRILNGDPDYQDSWHDIAGYAKLVEEQLQTAEKLQQMSATQPAGLSRGLEPQSLRVTDLDTGATMFVDTGKGPITLRSGARYGVHPDDRPKAIPDSLLDE